jgi:ParB/RepB/Spo0J family partition protein
MASSLLQFGQLSPIKVRPDPAAIGGYEVVFGNRRLAAAKSLGWAEIEADVVQATDQQALAMAFCENTDRDNFTDYEKALLLEKLHVETGKSYLEVSKMIGKSTAYVSLHVAMLHLFPSTVAPEEEIQRALLQLTEKHARVLGTVDDEIERWNTTKLAIKGHLSVRELEKLCGRASPRKKRESSNNYQINSLIRNIISELDRKNPWPFVSTTSKRKFSLFPLFPPLSKLNNEVAKEHFCSVLRYMREFHVKIDDLEITTSGNLAFALLQLTYKIKAAGKEGDARVMATIVFQKEDEWKIVHSHWSTVEPNPFVLVYPEINTTSRLLTKKLI